jgi:hypothetical protein
MKGKGKASADLTAKKDPRGGIIAVLIGLAKAPAPKTGERTV